ncbi:MAG: hypothetical protein AB2A00_39560, partial [Myxococcota bacterium]
MAEWIRGELQGDCLGRPTKGPGASATARWYQLTLENAVVRNVTPVAGPPSTSTGKEPFRQERVAQCTLTLANSAPDDPGEQRALVDVSVWDWEMRRHVEGQSGTQGTLVGTVYARLDAPAKPTPVPPRRRPPPPTPEPVGTQDRVDRSGCLALLLGILVGAWLWWHCGPFTCLLWAAVIGASWWTWRYRRRSELARPWWKVGLHGGLGLCLLALGLGTTLEMVDTVTMATCGTNDALRVLWVALALVGAALLTVSWPLHWLWVLWTSVMLLWCGRSGLDCAGQWARSGVDIVRGVAPDLTALGDSLDGLRQRMGGAMGWNTGSGNAGTGGGADPTSSAGQGEGGAAGLEGGGQGGRGAGAGQGAGAGEGGLGGGGVEGGAGGLAG